MDEVIWIGGFGPLLLEPTDLLIGSLSRKSGRHSSCPVAPLPPWRKVLPFSRDCEQPAQSPFRFCCLCFLELFPTLPGLSGALGCLLWGPEATSPVTLLPRIPRQMMQIPQLLSSLRFACLLVCSTQVFALVSVSFFLPQIPQWALPRTPVSRMGRRRGWLARAAHLVLTTGSAFPLKVSPGF